MLLLNIAAVVLFLAGLAVLFVRKFETTLETKVGPVKTPLGITMVIVAMAAFAFPYTPWYAKPTAGSPASTPAPCCVPSSRTPTAIVPVSPTPTMSQTAASGVVTFPADFAGTWDGLFTQDNGKSYDMRLIVTAGQSAAQVEYQPIGCQGTVTITSGAGSLAEAYETILRGPCTPTGEMVLDLHADGSLVVTYDPNGGATYSARAVLNKA